jgi:hypothetical protein
MPRRFACLVTALTLTACGGELARMPLREPLRRDTDLDPVHVACRPDPDSKPPGEKVCAPETYFSPLAWDAADNTVFRPLTRVFAVDPAGEATNANAFDEVADSAWFTNRIGQHPMTPEEAALGACAPAMILDPGMPDGSWVIDQGKSNGASLGFRIKVAGKKYMMKTDSKEQPERPTAASAIGAAIYHDVGFWSSCEQVVYFRPSLLKLTPGLKVTANVGGTRPFDQAALQQVLDEAAKKGDLVRMQASAWLPGRLLGPFRYEGTRADDPNDVIPHQDRRELRGARLLAAWLNHFDAREQNSMDSWIAQDPAAAASSPGHVRHYYLDTSDCFGSEWAWDGISRRLGYSYLLDFEHVGEDLLTLGLLDRPWDRVARTPGQEIFGYFNAKDFVPEKWQNEYSNPAFDRMRERDGAWMARILARFTPDHLGALVKAGAFSKPENSAHLQQLLQARLERVLKRYLTRLSPLSDLHVESHDRLCGVDLARKTGAAPESAFHYRAEMRSGEGPAAAKAVAVEESANAAVCLTLPHVAKDGGPADDAASRYVVLRIASGAAKGPLEAHLYDLGPARGYKLVGIERPAE